VSKNKYFTVHRKDGLEGFSFTAPSLEKATSKFKSWSRYHGYSFDDHNLVEVTKDEALYNCSGDEFMHRF
jgi:hypothetical protein